MLIGRRRSATGAAGGALTSVFIESLQDLAEHCLPALAHQACIAMSCRDQSAASFTYLTLLERRLGPNFCEGFQGPGRALLGSSELTEDSRSP